MTRPQVTSDQIAAGLRKLQGGLARRLNEKGYGALASRHEVLGVVTEEYDELVEAVRDHTVSDFDEPSSDERVEQELWDVAVAAVFGAVCVREGLTEW